MKSLLLIIFIFFCALSFSQNEKISSETKSIVKSLKKGNVYETAVLPKETKSKQLDLFEELKEVATTDELRQLTNHKNGVVRVYAFQALTEKTSKGIFDIILNHINDKEVIECHTLGFEFIHGRIYKREAAEFFVSSNTLLANERQLLDSVLLFSGTSLNYTDHLLRKIEPQEKYYNRIRELAQKEGYKYAVLALARYKRADDLSIIESKIKELPYYSLEAVEIFPNQHFKNILNDFNKSEAKPYGLYSAVAVYQDSFAFDYLSKSIQEPAKNDHQRKTKVKEIYRAINKYKCSIYNELFFQLWKTDCVINDSLFQYLANIDPDRSLQLSIQSLKEPEKIANSTLVIEDLLNFVIMKDTIHAKSIIYLNINNASVHKIGYYIEKAKNFKDNDIVNSLFSRLEQTDNGHIFVPIIEAVLSYNDQTLNNRLLDSLKANKGITGWGREKAIVLLEDHGLKL